MINHILEDGCESITNNYSSSHQAIDVVSACKGSDDVISANDGTVEMVVRNVKYTNHNARGAGTYGNYVKIKHSDGKKTLYAHMEYGSVNVSKGDSVTKGQKIGTIGETGNAYGKHLHFEVRDSKEQRENPTAYLNSMLEKSNEKTDVNIEKTSIKNENIEVSPSNQNEETETTNEISNEEISKENIEDITETKEDEQPNEKNSIEGAENTIETENTIKENEEEYKAPVLNLNHTSTANKETNKEETKVLENNNYKGGSIVDGLKGINIDSSFYNRSLIAEKNDIKDYKGTYEQNIYLLKLLKEGKLKY